VQKEATQYLVLELPAIFLNHIRTERGGNMLRQLKQAAIMAGHLAFTEQSARIWAGTAARYALSHF
jgi:hypothetical protein